MSTSREIPSAIKVFGCALLAGVGGCVGAFKLAMAVLPRFLPGDPTIVAALSVLASSAIGVASAVTAGVIAGRAARD
jgi:hypothetical protein